MDTLPSRPVSDKTSNAGSPKGEYDSPRSAALAYYAAGFNVLPIRLDGTKSPKGSSWREWESERQPPGFVEANWPGRREDPGVGIVTGPVSGGLAVIDFDRDAHILFPRFRDLVSDEFPDLLDRCAVHQSPAGFHVWFRCQACRPFTREVLAATSQYTTGKQTLVELRGHRHQTLAPGCPRACHPTKGLYQFLSGTPLVELAPITADEFLCLEHYVVSLNRKVSLPRLGPEDGGRQTPLDAYDVGPVDWVELLAPHGWEETRAYDGCRYFRRPDKDGRGHSATAGYCRGKRGEELLHVFSSNAHPFEAGRSYGKGRVYALLNHGGNLSAAARELRQLGYGDPMSPARRPAVAGEASGNGEAGQVEQLHPSPAGQASGNGDVVELVAEASGNGQVEQLHPSPAGLASGNGEAGEQLPARPPATSSPAMAGMARPLPSVVTGASGNAPDTRQQCPSDRGVGVTPATPSVAMAGPSPATSSSAARPATSSTSSTTSPATSSTTSPAAPGPAGQVPPPDGSAATKLVNLVMEEAEPFRDEAGQAWLRHCRNGRWEVSAIPSEGCDDYIRMLIRERESRTLNPDSLRTAVSDLASIARLKGRTHRVPVRLARDGGTILLDLADAERHVVQITSEGWKVLDTCNVPFRRPSRMKPLPMPKRKGAVKDLRDWVNVKSDAQWLLIQAWLVNAFWPDTEKAHLVLTGQQGAAKSTCARVLQSLVDPNLADLRSDPKDEQALAIAASSQWLMAFDNLSRLPAWLSDSLCRLSTGGTVGVRQLYTTDDERIWSAIRPVILTSIEELATNGDLLDRSILIELPVIPKGERLSREAFFKEWELERPAILGAVLDTVSCALRELPRVHLPEMPRMADFARVAVAAGPALGYDAEAFMEAYGLNEQAGHQVALEAGPLYSVIRELLDKNKGEWEGSVAKLHVALTALASEETRKQPGWPKGANRLGRDLARLGPALNANGIAYERAARSKATSSRPVSLRVVQT